MKNFTKLTLAFFLTIAFITANGAGSPLFLRPDSGTGIEGTAFTVNILENDSFYYPNYPRDIILGTATGQAVVSQYGTWTQGITLNTENGLVNVASTVPAGIYTVKYQLKINGFIYEGRSEATITVKGNPLPVELTSFRTTLQDNNIELTWHSATETNNDFYSIYKSNDGQIWKFWRNIRGAGNSNEELSYTEIDYEPYQDKNYYKLSQTDFDGTIKELGVSVVQFKTGDSNFSAYPNPTKGLITINGAHNNTNSLRIVSTLGTVVTNNVTVTSVSPRQLKLDFSNLPNGIYFIHLDNRMIQVEKQ